MIRFAAVLALTLAPAVFAAQVPRVKVGGGIVGKGLRKKGAANPKAMKRQLDKLSGMPEDERKEALARLPVERRKAVEKRLETYNSMSPEQRDRLVRAAQKMTPDQRRAAADGLAGMNKLSDERRRAVRRELNSLRAMTPEERSARLGGDEVKEKFSADERQVLGDMAKAMPSEK